MILLLHCSAFVGEPLHFAPLSAPKRKCSDESTASCEVLDEDTGALMRCSLDAVINLNSLEFVPRETG
jgi:hypothetical protein